MRIEPSTIVAAVLAEHGIEGPELEEFYDGYRGATHAAARQVAVGLLFEWTTPRVSFPRIARLVGHTNHSSAMHSLGRFWERLEASEVGLFALVDRVRGRVAGGVQNKSGGVV